MFTAVFLSAVALAAPVPKVTKPVGPPPTFVYVPPAADGRVKVYLRSVQTVTQNVTTTVIENGVPFTRVVAREVSQPVTTVGGLSDVGATFATADDKKLTADEANTRLKAGGVLVAPSAGDEVDPAYWKALSADAVVVTYTGKGEERKTLQAARPRSDGPTPTVPTLVAVKADAKGVVHVPAVGTKEITAVQVTFLNGEKAEKLVKRTVTALVPTPFDDVKPEATTADGKPVPADEAKKQLAAGAIVLVSGDGKPVDEVFRKLVRPTTLVLASPRMHLPSRATPLPGVLALPQLQQAVPVPAK